MSSERDRQPDGRRPIRRALVSVYDKTGLAELAAALQAAGVEIVSTGSTAQQIADTGAPVTPVGQVTGFPEMLDGRVKTLHPKVHAGLLADLRLPEHAAALDAAGIAGFDLLVSNLYPFRETVASGAGPDEVVEQIDIGGPAMVRAAAKNHPTVAVVTSPADYPQLIATLEAGGFTLDERKTLAAKAFSHTASYDVAVASWMNTVLAPEPAAASATQAAADSAESDTPDDAGRQRPAFTFPRWTGATWERAQSLRYGENPHQQAALYRHWRPGLATAELLHGKEMSYNNYVDIDAAWRLATDFDDPAVAIMKHANPCGIAIVPGGDPASIVEAHHKALASDPVSAFGGVIAVNRTVTGALAEQIADVFTEVLAAPDFDEDALAVLTGAAKGWRQNLRLLRMPADATPDPWEFRAISGGILAQTRDNVDAPGDDPAGWSLVSGEPVDAATLDDLAFAWRACRSVKSNAILLAKDAGSVGIGMGQVNRVDSCRLAVERAGDRAAGSVAASDAYFPFADGPQVLFDAGVRAVVQPGGSVRDNLTVEAAQAAGVSMYFTSTRHFFH
ncbi:bifunctional phosphoribosylaminoimidazolecarboxamide formyltransferase/IMP cyclohydrolase [Nakamurella sp. DB0629]|uniref:Bifunctional purine biosynthesis protein PurH n=1 Tax=Nakamurella aerolata TaxID=1656892 RepID=A0A849AA07_9ACTN|nr:bifunctional phosphoribosylaminoimidazolecarboxamide formyltransferase/IMP cyclohydrolase [Nakamurella aerolata]